MGTVAPSRYNIKIKNKKVFKEPIQLDLGGVFTFVIAEDDTGNYVSVIKLSNGCKKQYFALRQIALTFQYICNVINKN